MKKTIVLMLALLLAVGGMAQEKKAKKEKTYNEKGEIIKKGWNFGPPLQLQVQCGSFALHQRLGRVPLL